MLKTVIAAATAVELVAVGVVATQPEFAGTRRAFLRQAKDFIENRHFPAGSVDATLDAVTLRDINALRRTAKGGWWRKDLAPLCRVVMRTGTPLMVKGAKVAFNAADAKVRQGIEQVMAWGEQVVLWPAEPKTA